MPKAERIEGWDGTVLPLKMPGEQPFETSHKLQKLVDRALTGLVSDPRDRRIMRGQAMIDEAIFPDQVDPDNNYWPDFIEIPTDETSQSTQKLVSEIANKHEAVITEDSIAWAIGTTLFVGQTEMPAEVA